MDAEKHKCNGEPDRVVDVSLDGDVILIVGADKVRLRVYSQCLRSASKIFNAMFGPHWSEGQRLTEGSPIEVALPEDDADAMRTICYIVHHRNDLISQHLTTKEILQIAIEVDKYDLRIALRFASVEWLKPPVNAKREEMGHLLATAFLFENTDAFEAHFMKLLLHYDGSYLEFWDDELTTQVIPFKVFSLLEERRTRFRAELCDILIRGKKAGCKCGWGKPRSEEYGRILEEHMPTKMLDAPMADIITKMSQLPTGETRFRLRMAGCGSHEPLPPLLEMVDAMKKRASIDIDYVKRVKTTDP